MKKLIFTIAVIFALSAPARADFTSAIGGECARIIYNMSKEHYPDNYETMKLRNSQFWALKKCLEIYKNEGGKREELDKHYELADMVASWFFDKCNARADKTIDDCYKLRLDEFAESASLPAVVLKQQYCKNEENKELCVYLNQESEKEMRVSKQAD